jgi:hypothetical protein
LPNNGPARFLVHNFTGYNLPTIEHKLTSYAQTIKPDAVVIFYKLGEGAEFFKAETEKKSGRPRKNCLIEFPMTSCSPTRRLLAIFWGRSQCG